MKKIFLVFIIFMLLISCVETPVDKFGYKHIYYELSDNVWYIPGNNSTFVKYYQKFIDDNPELEKRILCIFADGTGDSGRDCGYFVILKK